MHAHRTKRFTHEWTLFALAALAALLVPVGPAVADGLAAAAGQVGSHWRLIVSERQENGREDQPPVWTSTSRLLTFAGIAAENGETFLQMRIAPGRWDDGGHEADPATYLLWLHARTGELDRVEKLRATASGRCYVPATADDLGGPAQRVLPNFFLPGYRTSDVLRTGKLRYMTAEPAGEGGAEKVLLTGLSSTCVQTWSPAGGLLPTLMEAARKDEPVSVRVAFLPLSEQEASLAAARARQARPRASDALSAALPAEMREADLAPPAGLPEKASAPSPAEPASGREEDWLASAAADARKADEPIRHEPPPHKDEPRSTWEFFTGRRRVYAPMLADQREALTHVGYKAANGEHCSNLDIQIGGDAVAVYYRPTDQDALSLSIRGLITGRLDMEADSFPLLNSDYIIGLALGWRRGPHSAEMFVYHQSSHLGDESLENGRTRVDYSHESVRLMYSYDWGTLGFGKLRTYAGATWHIRAWPGHIRHQWRLQGGAEYTWLLWEREMYVAADAQVLTSECASTNLTLQYGVYLSPPGQEHFRQRVFAELFTGQSNMGQFFDTYERTFLIGYGLEF